METKEHVFIYARVSSDKQDYERQIVELTRYAESQNYKVVKFYQEKMSGSIDIRESLENMILDLEKLAYGSVSKVIVWEFSRLGRTTIGTLQNISRIKRTNTQIYIYSGSLTISTIPNAFSDLLVTILTGVAELEKENIVARLQSGRSRSIEKKNGTEHLGRKIGTKKNLHETKHYKDIVRYLSQDFKVTHIAKLTNTSRNTIYKIKDSIS